MHSLTLFTIIIKYTIIFFLFGSWDWAKLNIYSSTAARFHCVGAVLKSHWKDEAYWLSKQCSLQGEKLSCHFKQMPQERASMLNDIKKVRCWCWGLFVNGHSNFYTPFKTCQSYQLITILDFHIFLQGAWNCTHGPILRPTLKISVIMFNYMPCFILFYYSGQLIF